MGPALFDVDVEGLGGGEGLWKLLHVDREEPVMVFRVDRFLPGLGVGVLGVQGLLENKDTHRP